MNYALPIVSALSLAACVALPGGPARPPAAGPPDAAPQAQVAQLDGALPGAALPGSPLLRLCFVLGLGWVGMWLGRRQSAFSAQEVSRPGAGLLDEPGVDFEADLRAGREVQELLVPPVPAHPGLEIGRHMQTARILGGDAVDLSLAPDGRLAITVADVSGKGSPAALAGALLVGMLDDAPARYTSPAETLRYLNERLTARLPEGLFVTFFHALLDPDRGELTYANGGHDLPFLVRRAGPVEELPTTGMALGILGDVEFEERTLSLSAGDLLFCYTDGITDQRGAGGERLGGERLRALVGELSRQPCPDLVAALARRVVGGLPEIQDDITLVAVRVRGNA